MRRLLAGLALLVVAVVMVATPADAVDTVESGWWWREQPSDGALPPPPQVPASGLRVASDASGPSAVAAVRVPLSSGERNAVLTLKVAAGSMQGVVLTACPAKGAWTPVSAGAWSSRPEPDCAGGAVAGAPSADATSVVFDLSTLAPSPASGAVDVVVFASSQPLPVDPSPLPVPRDAPPTADVSFAKPVPADVAVTSDGTGDGASGASDTPLPDALASPDGYGATTAFDDAAPLPSFDVPPAPTPTGTPTAAAATPAPRTGAPLTALTTPPALRRVASTFDRVGEARDRLLAAFVFVDLLVVWWLLERRRSTVVDGDGRPRLSLHDDPTAVLALHAARLTRRPPTLRPADIPPLR